MSILDDKFKKYGYSVTYFALCFILAYVGVGSQHKVVASTFASVFAMLLFIWLFSKKLISDEVIYADRKCIYVFAIIYVLEILISLIIAYGFSINNSNINGNNIGIVLLCQLIINLLIFICYAFKISLGKFKWNISLLGLGVVFIIFLAGRPLLFLISNGTTNIFQVLKAEFYLGTIYHIYYPAFSEEMLYRGFLISGLKSFGLSDLKCNIIQSVFFGVMHIFGFGVFTINMLLTTCMQMVIGYVLGKLYFKTKSLVPSIILHALWDSYML